MQHNVSRAGAFAVFGRIGILSFGGPAGQIALMHKMLVDDHKWLDEGRFLHALNYCMLLPGPEAQQLAIYAGWLLHGVRGGLVAGLLFVAPGALVMLGLSILYVTFNDLPLVQGVFFGVKAAVMAIVVEALLRISKRALKTRLAIALAALAFIAIYILHLPFPLIVLAAGAAGWILGRVNPDLLGIPTPDEDEIAAAEPIKRGHLLRTITVWGGIWLAPIAALFLVLGGSSVFVQEGVFFAKLAIVTFGGAYAVLAYMAQAAVETHGWLAAGEMVDGLGLAETTPGPLIIVTQFVGFMGAWRNPGGLDPILAGTLGAVVTLWATFAPSFLWIFAGAPYMERLRANRALSAALAAITAAVVGVIANLALWFGIRVLFGDITQIAGIDVPVPASLDPYAMALGGLAFALLLVWHKGVPLTLLICAMAGAGLRLLI